MIAHHLPIVTNEYMYVHYIRLYFVVELHRVHSLYTVTEPVRGTPALHTFSAFPAISLVSALASTPAIPPANAPNLLPACSRWHMLCDQACDHCRYLRTRATG
jgi:hypothetical protein